MAEPTPDTPFSSVLIRALARKDAISPYGKSLRRLQEGSVPQVGDEVAELPGEPVSEPTEAPPVYPVGAEVAELPGEAASTDTVPDEASLPGEPVASDPLTRDEDELIADREFDPDFYYLKHKDAVAGPDLDKLARVKAGKLNASTKVLDGAVELGGSFLRSAVEAIRTLPSVGAAAVKTGWALTSPGIMSNPKRAAGAAVETVASMESALLQNAEIFRKARQAYKDVLRRHPALAVVVDPAESFQNSAARATKFTPEEAKERLIAGRVAAETLQETTAGEGAWSSRISAALKEAGIEVEIDPETVDRLSFITDFANIIPGGSGFKAVTSGGRVLLRGATEAAVRAGVGKMREVVGATLQKSGAGMQKATAVRGGTLGVAIDLATGGGSAGGGALAGAAVGVWTRQAGKVVENVGDVVAGAAPVPGIIKTGGEIIEGGLRGAAGALNPLHSPEGLFYSGAAGLELAAGNYEDAGSLLGNQVGYGALGGVTAASKNAAGRAVHRKVLQSFRPTSEVLSHQPTQAVGANAAWDAEHHTRTEALRERTPDGVNRFNWFREVVRQFGYTPYILGRDAFEAAVAESRGTTVAEARARGIDYGATKGFFNERTGDIFLNTDLVAAGHEIGHALSFLMPEGTRSDFYNALSSAYGPDQVAEFGRYYDSLLGRAGEGRPSNTQAVLDEMAAEMLSTLISSENTQGMPAGAAQKGLEWLAGLGEQMGLYRPVLGGEGASTLGVQPSAAAAVPARQFLRDTFMGLGAARARAAGTLVPPVLPGGATPGPVPPPIVPPAPGATPTPPPASGTTPASTPPPAGPTPPPGSPPSPPPAGAGPTPPPVSPPSPPSATPPAPGTGPSRGIYGTGGAAFEGTPRRIPQVDEAEAQVTAQPTRYSRKVFDTLVGTMSAPLGAVPPVQIGYRSVKTAGAPPTPGQRYREREAAYVAEAMAQGGVPADVRALVEKVTVPYRFEVRDDNVNVNAMSPDKVVANAHRLAQLLNRKGGAATRLFPYPIGKDGKITPDGWRGLVRDTIAYTRNQANGYAGDGSTITVPPGYHGGLNPVNPDYTPVPIPLENAYAVNVLMGIAPPQTAKAPKGMAGSPITAYPNVQAGMLAEGNRRFVVRPAPTSRAGQNVYDKKGGGTPVGIAETNPLRAQLAAAGIDLSGKEGLHRVTEELSLEEIDSVTPVPTNEFRAPNTPAMTASFMPKRADERTSGLAFKGFFSDVTRGAEKYRPQAPWKSVLPLDEQGEFLEEYNRHTGNFDAHIATSIPVFKDAQVRVGAALADTLPPGSRVLDVGASEGSWLKAVVAKSGGSITGVALDPNPDMAQFFREKSTVPGAAYVEEAFQNGFEDGGRVYGAHDPKEAYDAVHESMVFQFISPDRAGQIAEAKRLLKPDGMFITEEKVLTEDPAVWRENEAKKDRDWKNQFYTDDMLKAKQAVVKFNQNPAETKAVGMVDNMVTGEALEAELRKNFAHVAQYWDSGNFRGYVASDNKARMEAFVRAVGDMNTDFSTRATPRSVGGSEAKFMPEVTLTPETGDPITADIDTAAKHIEKVWFMPDPTMEGPAGYRYKVPVGYRARNTWEPHTEAGRKLESDGFEILVTETDHGGPESGFSAPDGSAINLVLLNGRGEAVGGITTTKPNANTINVENTWLVEALRGRGIGEALYRELGALAQDLDVTKLTELVVGIGAAATRRKVFGDKVKATELGGPMKSRSLTDVIAAMQAAPAGGVSEKGRRLAEANGIPIQPAPARPVYTDRAFDITSKVDPDARFMPGVTGEKVEAAALRADDGRIYTGLTHALAAMELPEGVSWESLDDGFVTSAGRFVSREEAFRMATTGEKPQVAPKEYANFGFLTAPGAFFAEKLESETFGATRKFMPAPPVDSVAFNKWFTGSKIRDEVSVGPTPVFHGTFSDFTKFDPKRGSVEGFWGSAVYSTTSPKDASFNYADLGGGDVVAKRDRIRERVQEDMLDDDVHPELRDSSGDIDENKVEAYVETQLGNATGPVVMPLWVKAKNPLYVGADRENTQFTLPAALKLIEAVETAARLERGALEGARATVYDNDGGRAEQVIQAIRDDEVLMYHEESTGELDSGEMIRRGIEKRGFDAIVDRNPAARWPRLMKDVPGDTQHIMVFRPENVKSATGNHGDFDPKAADIRFMPTMAEMEAKWDRAAKRQKGGLRVLPKKEPQYPKTGWVLPTGDYEGITAATANAGDFHGQFLTQNAERLAGMGVDVGEGGVAAREKAIDAGMIRVRNDSRRGSLTIEGTVAAIRKHRPVLEKMLAENVDSTDRVTVNQKTKGGDWVSSEADLRDSDDRLADAVATLRPGRSSYMPAVDKPAPAGEASDMGFESKAKAIRDGSEFGATFNLDGSEFVPTEPSDVVTLTNVNVPLSELTGDRIARFVDLHAGAAAPGVVVGAFKLDGKENAASIDLNVVVPKRHRENTLAFAKANGQESIFDLESFEVVPAGGDSNPRLKADGDLREAAKRLAAGEPFDWSAWSSRTARARQSYRGFRGFARRGASGGRYMPDPTKRVVTALQTGAEKNRIPALAERVSFEDVLAQLPDHPELKPFVERSLELVEGQPGFARPAGVKNSDYRARFNAARNKIAENLVHLWDETDPAKREAWRQWYELANDLSERLAAKHGISMEAAAGVNAALSPQKEWNENVSSTFLLLDTIDRDPAFTQAHRDFTYQILSNRAEDKPAQKAAKATALAKLDAIKDGTKLSELANEEAAWMVRADNELFSDQRVRDHTGAVVPNPKVRKVRWASYRDIQKAIAIRRDQSAENISRQLGEAHKVRNFYNNHVDPTNAQDVTMDTHAVGAAFLQAVGSEDVIVKHNFGTGPGSPQSTQAGYSGIFSLLADAYRQAAAQRGALPREMQSVTWEAVREIFPADAKKGKLKSAVLAVHKAVEAGEISAAEGRKTIVEIGRALGARAPHTLSPEARKYLPKDGVDVRQKELELQ